MNVGKTLHTNPFNALSCFSLEHLIGPTHHNNPLSHPFKTGDLIMNINTAD